MTRTTLRWQLTLIALAMALGAGCRDRPAAENPSASKAEAPPPGAAEKPVSDPVATATPNTGTAAPDPTKSEQPLAAGESENSKKSF